MLSITRATLAKSYNTTMHAFMDIAIGSEKPRHVVYELYGNKCPLAVENFMKLCTGENVIPPVNAREGLGEATFGDQFLPQLTYRNSTFHRVSNGYLVQGGDIVTGTGEGQLSIFGETFDAPDEVKSSTFDRKWLLGTAVSAPHLNGSQFFILTANSAPHLNGTCICFGRVKEGVEVIEDIQKIQVRPDGQPSVPIRVVNCGNARK